MAHISIPKYVPLHTYFDEEALTALQQVGWLIHSEESELRSSLEEALTVEQRKALRELAVIAQEALTLLEGRKG